MTTITSVPWRHPEPIPSPHFRKARPHGRQKALRLSDQWSGRCPRARAIFIFFLNNRFFFDPVKLEITHAIPPAIPGSVLERAEVAFPGDAHRSDQFPSDRCGRMREMPQGRAFANPTLARPPQIMTCGSETSVRRTDNWARRDLRATA
jgi:hypothetical protein